MIQQRRMSAMIPFLQGAGRRAKCCSCGSCKDSAEEEEIAMKHFVRGSSQSLPEMVDTADKAYQARVAATL